MERRPKAISFFSSSFLIFRTGPLRCCRFHLLPSPSGSVVFKPSSMTRRSTRQPSPPHRAGRTVLAGLAVSALLIGVLVWWFLSSPAPPSRYLETANKPTSFVRESDAVVFARYGGSASCRECHARAFEAWAPSHHALAERLLNPALDREAFDPPRQIRHASQSSQSRLRDGRYEIMTRGADGQPHAFNPQHAIGVDPLVQYLFGTSNGLVQCTELAWDPARKEWFDVYGQEDRQPGEWGHWTGRGMTWNFMCASCHNTRFRRHYEPASDGYASTLVEAGVGCEACHGPMADHIAWQRAHPQKGAKDPTARRLTTNQMFEVCGTCHARRTDLTGDFVPGDQFADHFILTIVDDSDTYYPDGQVRDEDYEYASLLSSRMWVSGVRCVHCHDPHSGKTRLHGDALCLQCHSAPVPPAPKIDPARHSFHQPGTPGDRCVDCHMPLTAYMQRHLRHDHGFTIPDPQLTKEFGIPNACNRCHTNQIPDWSISWTEKWYSSRKDRASRSRARIVAAARAGADSAAPNLVGLLASETNPVWRASVSLLLRPWARLQSVTPALISASRDRDPLVRAMTARVLEGVIEHDTQARYAVESLLVDPLRVVRVQAAWALHSTVDTNSVAGQDMLVYLLNNMDHVSGAAQLGLFLADRGDTKAGLRQFETAIGWDSRSPGLRDSAAVLLSQLDRPAEAVAQLQEASRLAPKDAIFRFRLGLALNETDQLDQAVRALEEAVKLDPKFGDAWYNLGLGYARQHSLEAALDALQKAEHLNPASARVPLALASVLRQLGRTDEAQAAEQRARGLAQPKKGLKSSP